jgi:hypothetical protein
MASVDMYDNPNNKKTTPESKELDFITDGSKLKDESDSANSVENPNRIKLSIDLIDGKTISGLATELGDTTAATIKKDIMNVSGYIEFQFYDSMYYAYGVLNGFSDTTNKSISTNQINGRPVQKFNAEEMIQEIITLLNASINTLYSSVLGEETKHAVQVIPDSSVNKIFGQLISKIK